MLFIIICVSIDAISPFTYEVTMPKKRDLMLSIYLNKISQRPLLSEKEEQALIQRIENGDITAENELVEANLRLVVPIAKKYLGKSLNLTLFGLIQEGNMGLVRAARVIKSHKGAKFSTYSHDAIHQAIWRGLVRDRPRGVSLDAQLGARDDEHSLHNVMHDERSVCPSTEAEGNSLLSLLEQAISALLDERENTIISLSFGLKDGILHTPKEIGKMLNMRTSKVRDIKKRALRRLAKHTKIKKLK